MDLKRNKDSVNFTYGIRASKETRRKLTELKKAGVVIAWLFKNAVNKVYEEEIGQFKPDADGVSPAEEKVLRAMAKIEAEQGEDL